MEFLEIRLDAADNPDPGHRDAAYFGIGSVEKICAFYIEFAVKAREVYLFINFGIEKKIRLRIIFLFIGKPEDIFYAKWKGAIYFKMKMIF